MCIKFYNLLYYYLLFVYLIFYLCLIIMGVIFQLVRGSIGGVIERYALFETAELFGKRYSVGEVLRGLICANLLYPASRNS